MLDPESIERYLYQNIPLSKAMGVRVEEATLQKVILSAPFAPNINHKKTVFGGSLHAIATLACWCLLYLHLKAPLQIVIAKSEITYKLPVDGDFRVECERPEKPIWERFLKTIQTKGRARIPLTATISHRGEVAVEYRALFAALSTYES